jgi:SNF2 family DNA or RNA helicase
MLHKELENMGRAHLNEHQSQVLKECLVKGSGGLSLPMGFGKSILSIVLGLAQSSEKGSNHPILVVASKTLLESWKFEIKKFFGDKLTYVVLHQDSCKDLDACNIDCGVNLVLTTPEVVSKYYKKEHIDTLFVQPETMNVGLFGQYTVNRYVNPVEPFSKGGGGTFLFSRKWPCLIIDEVQKYTNMTSMRCQGLCAICADSRWGMSGTIFDEPKIERILGYYVIINDKTFPRTIPDALRFTKKRSFKGFEKSTVHRKTNEAFKAPRLNEVIVAHEFNPNEEKLYISMKGTMMKIRAEMLKYRNAEDVENARRFGSYLMAMLTYLRQCIVCPILPLAKAALDISDLNNKSRLSQILVQEIDNMDLGEWLNKEESVKSSRIKKALEVIQNHDNERVVIFTCFRTCLDIVKHFLPTSRPNFTLSASMSSKRRGDTLVEFGESRNGVLLLTYEVGAEGLNLQCSSTILMLDFWWNSGKTQQATARVLRYGQLSEVVNVYYFMSNTGVEKAVFKKQFEKQAMLAELKDGPMVTKLQSINVNDIISIIDAEDNARLICGIHRGVRPPTTHASKLEMC